MPFMQYINSIFTPQDLSFSFTSPSETHRGSNLVAEYGECWPVGDNDAGASSPRGEKDGIAFSQADSGCHHEKLLLVAKQCAVGSTKPPNITPHELPCQSLQGVTDATWFQPTVKGRVSNGDATKILMDHGCFYKEVNFTGARLYMQSQCKDAKRHESKEVC